MLQDLGWLSAFSALRSLAANTGFYGVLPDELSMLCQLSSLDLSSSGLEILPHWLPQLSQLRVLDLAEASVRPQTPTSAPSPRLTPLTARSTAPLPQDLLRVHFEECNTQAPILARAGHERLKHWVRSALVSLLSWQSHGP